MKPLTWLWNIAVALDRALNAVLRGNPKQTISTRAAAARSRGRWWGCVLCRLLDRIDENHCKEAVELDDGTRPT